MSSPQITRMFGFPCGTRPPLMDDRPILPLGGAVTSVPVARQRPPVLAPSGIGEALRQCPRGATIPAGQNPYHQVSIAQGRCRSSTHATASSCARLTVAPIRSSPS